jgi:hypothetical protein
MNRLIAATFFISVATAAAGAMPLAPVDRTLSSNVVKIAGGCGPGFHRGPFGGCRRNYAPGTVHACPRGYHVGPGGGCRGNGR